MSFVARINNKEDFKLRLKKIYQGSGPTEYEFKLCCPAIVELENSCPGSEKVTFRIPRCVIFDGIVFNVKINNIEISGSNLTTCESFPTPNVIPDDECVYIQFNVDTVLNINKLCVKKVSIPVTPSCYNNKSIEVPFSNFGNFVYYG